MLYPSWRAGFWTVAPYYLTLRYRTIGFWSVVKNVGAKRSVVFVCRACTHVTRSCTQNSIILQGREHLQIQFCRNQILGTSHVPSGWRGVRVGQVWGFSLRFYAYIPHVNYNNNISTQRLHLHLIVCKSSYFYLNFIFFLNKIVTVLPTGRSLGLARRLSPELVRTGDQGPILDTPLWFHKNV